MLLDGSNNVSTIIGTRDVCSVDRGQNAEVPNRGQYAEVLF